MRYPLEETLVTAVISDPRIKGQKIIKVSIRPIVIKGLVHYQVTDHYADKVLHKNISQEEYQALVKKLFKEDFKQGIFHTEEGDYTILIDKNENVKVSKKSPTKKSENLLHNRQKQYLLKEGEAIPFLVELGIMNSVGKVYAEKRDKFKQMNRFLEIVTDILPVFKKKKKIQILDFGCGKAYLTFALYHYLTQILNYELEIIGLDLKEDVIAHCQSLAKKFGFSHLHFYLGDINTFQVERKIDLMVTLHACNTATDAALEKAVRSETDVILAVPCCQHELFNQVDASTLKPLLQYGILKERFAALATDAARGKLLEILGYSVQILEFIDMEHTPKNLLIRAVRKTTPQTSKDLTAEYAEFKKFLHISPSLEKRFSKELSQKGLLND